MTVSAISGDIQAVSFEGAADSACQRPDNADVPDGRFQSALAAAKLRSNSGAPDVHTVEAGESLWRIVSSRLAEGGAKPSPGEIADAVKQVARTNGIQNPNLILVGQALDLSALDVAAEAPAESRAPSSALTLASSTPVSLVERAPGSKSWQPIIDFRAVGGPPHTVAEAGPAAASRRLELASLLEKARISASTRERSGQAASPWSRLLSKPAHLTSEYGMRRDPFTGKPQYHDGVDLAVAPGARISPYAAGTVVKSGWEPGYGKVVRVRHANGLETVYGHNLTNLVREGDRVDEKSTLALVGSSGRSTGPHLHFEVRRNGRSVNPVPYLKTR